MNDAMAACAIDDRSAYLTISTPTLYKLAQAGPFQGTKWADIGASIEMRLING